MSFFYKICNILKIHGLSIFINTLIFVFIQFIFRELALSFISVSFFIIYFLIQLMMRVALLKDINKLIRALLAFKRFNERIKKRIKNIKYIIIIFDILNCLYIISSELLDVFKIRGLYINFINILFILLWGFIASLWILAIIFIKFKS